MSVKLRVTPLDSKAVHLFQLSLKKKLIIWIIWTTTDNKHRENRKMLPFEHLIGCQSVKLFLLNYVTINAVTTATVTNVTITTVTI